VNDTLQWAIWAVLMAIVMGWLGRSRTGPSNLREGVLAHPKSVLTISVVCTAFFGALVFLSIRFPGRNPTIWAPIIFSALALTGLFLLADYYRARHELRPDGLRYGRTLGRGGLARWEDVRRVAYSDGMKWFRLELEDGRVVRLSAMLQGLPRLAAELLARVPPDAISTKTRSLLEATAAGKPPSVWQ
jgi:hypothetical protein